MNNVPTPELIEAAKQDHLLAAITRGPGTMPLSEARQLAEQFRPTHHIRTLSIPSNEAKYLDWLGAYRGMNAPAMLRQTLQTAFSELVDGNVETGITLWMPLLPPVGETTQFRQFPLNPEIFVPLAHEAMRQKTDSSTVARAALASIVDSPYIFGN